MNRFLTRLTELVGPKAATELLADFAGTQQYVPRGEVVAPKTLQMGGWVLPRSIFTTEYEFCAFMAPSEAADRLARAVVERSLWALADYQSLPGCLQQQVVRRAHDLGMQVPADFLQAACKASGQSHDGNPGRTGAAPK